MYRHLKLSFSVAVCTLETQVHHGLQNLHVSTAKAGSEGFAEVLRYVGSHVDTHFVSKRGRTHGEAERRGERI